MSETRRRILAALVAGLAVCAILVPGVGAQPDPAPDEPFIWPTTGRVSQPYGCTGFRFEPRRGSCAHFHGGIDIANERGTPIRAAADGVVSHVGWDPWLPRAQASWMVIINHGSGLQTMYAHLLQREIEDVSPGLRVRQGQLIGLMGSTGLSTGPHLHFSFMRNGSWADPGDFMVGKPLGRNAAKRSSVRRDCPAVGAGMGAWLGGTTALVLEFDTPDGCAA